VELAGELILFEQLGDAAGRRDVARDERAQRGRVELVRSAGGRDELAVLVDEENRLVRVNPAGAGQRSFGSA
jgi:hypothetical protein